MMPSIVFADKQGPRATDLISNEFTEHRKIYLVGEVNDASAAEIIVQLEHLDRKGKEDILFYINSPGGSVSAGLAIYDAMKRCRCDVVTICTGMAASMGAFLFSSGTKGKRYITPMAEVMIHQPLGGAQGQASDIERAAAHILFLKKRLNAVLSANTGKTLEEIAADTDRDTYLSADEAIRYGLADALLEKNL